MRTLSAKEYNKIVKKGSNFHIEDDLQMTFMQWFWAQYPTKLIWHTPNGGRRNKFEAARLKKMGVLPGVPDIFIAEPNDYFHGLYIEFKLPDMPTSDAQKTIHEKLLARNYSVNTCYNINESIQVCRLYLSISNDQKNP